MLTGTTLFTGLVSGADVSGTIVQYAYVFGGIVIVAFVLSPLFITKAGFQWILSKASKAMGLGGK